MKYTKLLFYNSFCCFSFKNDKVVDMGKQKCCLNVDFFVSVTNQYDEVIITTA